ncbi:cupin domain-containing protein [Spirosoma koreense]
MNTLTNTALPQSHEQLFVLTTLITLLVPSQATAGKYSVWEETVPPLAGPPPHSHPDEEVFYVLDGSFEFFLHDLSQPIQATTGAAIHIPSQALHTYRNRGTTAGKLLTMATPGKLEAYFRAVGKPVHSAEDVPDLNQVPDFPNLDARDFLERAPEHKVTFYFPQSEK